MPEESPRPLRFLTIEQVAQELNVGEPLVRAMLKSGELRGIQLGGRGVWRIGRGDVEAYVEQAYLRTAEKVACGDFAEPELSQAGAQVTRRAPMNESIQAEVARTLSTIPLRASRQMTAIEYQFRASEVLRLFDIDAVADETGVYYGGEGVELEDQPLLWAIRMLLARRFGIPEALAI